MSEIEITQGDRNAAAALIESRKELYSSAEYLADVRDGEAGGDFSEAFARHRHEARADGERYKRALMDIGAAIQAGRVCDDVAWFDEYETLFDFVSSALEPDHTEPSPDMLGNFPISRDERRIIEWLRRAGGDFGDIYAAAAQEIERGEHRK